MLSERRRQTCGRLMSVALFMGTLLVTAPLLAEPVLSLDFVSREKLKNASSGLKEPSGLTLSAVTGELWAVSDDTSAVFRFSPDDPATVITLPINENEMEAITLAESDGKFFTINEVKGRISCFAMSDGPRLASQKIHAMAGYADIRASIKAASSKSGFEGIAWHPGRGSLFAVLEGPPGLLVEISADLKTILSSTPLTAARGFIDPDNPDATVDFSGLSNDAKRERLWILSDEAARVFVFDLASSQVTQSLPLHWLSGKDKEKTVDKPEGISLSLDGTQLYVVSDSEARLYQWQIRQH